MRLVCCTEPKYITNTICLRTRNFHTLITPYISTVTQFHKPTGYSDILNDYIEETMLHETTVLKITTNNIYARHPIHAI